MQPSAILRRSRWGEASRLLLHLLPLLSAPWELPCSLHYSWPSHSSYFWASNKRLSALCWRLGDKRRWLQISILAIPVLQFPSYLPHKKSLLQLSLQPLPATIMFGPLSILGYSKLPPLAATKASTAPFFVIVPIEASLACHSWLQEEFFQVSLAKVSCWYATTTGWKHFF